MGPFGREPRWKDELLTIAIRGPDEGTDRSLVRRTSLGMANDTPAPRLGSHAHSFEVPKGRKLLDPDGSGLDLPSPVGLDTGRCRWFTPATALTPS